ncbi:hypothetical protein PTTG_09807 [Puccinia triticina 1-1 BBBD Race 1]|uniref:Palmitoyltransferase n=2 Tax=Puccinia triticina TaxID=208348 RepID=A0A180H5C0_PUCT1|nr:uncharacterized protein PtA15_9A125 [Puccinia triticina]OAW00146.1 hypothetical protein PTTG_09807 [Puccinia triticina 1-1 BBBD Race 1]WAQ88000.1 hypothetical protein PtA15_9A125 [Puccinia triticina]WAR60192.1 hypothetical protein PtB15_9B129 [Puccinia triticina]
MATSGGGYRLNKVLNRIVPSLMFLMIFLGSRLVLNHSIPHLLANSSGDGHRWIKLYRLVFISQLSLAVGWYLAIYFDLFGHHHSSANVTSSAIVQKIINKSIVYQCVDQIGSPLRCPICDDQIVPVRARHCLDCGICVPGFDHHCVWFAQCISITSTLKPFIQVLVLGATTIVAGAGPIYPIVVQHVKQVVRLTWSAQSSGDTLRRIWWDRWWGWAGGPVYRYMGGLCLGYLYYHEISPQDASPSTPAADDRPKTSPKGSSVLDEPSLSVLMIILAATMVLLVILAMLTIVFKNNILNGLSTIEIERARRSRRSPGDARLIKLWVPPSASAGQPTGKVVLVPPGLPIFDLRPSLNFQLIMGKRVWHWFVPWKTSGTPDGVEWPISDQWLGYLRSLDPYTEE